ncbi:MAG: YceD family protein [Pleurocapsa sp. MO_226.B13]|nr:YceD family protein [Pleurocapsa sp. MO_226.B13]
MEAIYIPHLLKAPKRRAEIIVNDTIARLNTLTPVKGKIAVRHGGNFLEVSSQAETIVTLTCDRCLQHYNHRLAIDTSELIWLESRLENIEDLPAEREVPLEDLSETLPPHGHFDPETWLFEQLSLALPLRRVCGESCPGAAVTSSKEDNGIDSRWSSLAALKEQLNGN